MNALLYRRVSTAKQDNSLAAQEQLMVRYCEALGYIILAIFEDNDTSGSIPMAERPGGGALLRRLEELRRAHPGPAEDFQLHVVTAKQDRMGRDTLDQIATIRRLWSAGATPHFAVEGGALPRTSQNELLFEIKASVSQHERNQIRERIRIGLEHKRNCGELTGTVPYGWDAVPTGDKTSKGVAIRELVDNHDEQHWLLHMASRREEGWGFHRIAKELNARGVPTKTPKGTLIKTKTGERFSSGLWQSGNVANILKNRTALAWLDEVKRLGSAQQSAA